jgi:regulatory protein
MINLNNTNLIVAQKQESENPGEQALQIVLDHAVRLLEAQPKTRKQLVRRLKLHGFEASLIEEALDRLERAGILNDQEFARIWITSRRQYRPRGDYVLKQELIKKGVEIEVIEAAFEICEPADQQQMVRDLVEKKWKALAYLSPAERKKRILNFLSRRGFRYDVAQEVLRDFE